MVVSEVRWYIEREQIREEKIPVLRIEGGNSHQASLSCLAHALTGGLFAWENTNGTGGTQIAKRRKGVGGGQVKFNKTRIMSDGPLVLKGLER